jgi:hypothetical protein
MSISGRFSRTLRIACVAHAFGITCSARLRPNWNAGPVHAGWYIRSAPHLIRKEEIGDAVQNFAVGIIVLHPLKEENKPIHGSAQEKACQ